MTQNKVIDCIHEGLTSVDYIRDFDRLINLGFTIDELKILSDTSIPTQDVTMRDLDQLFTAMGYGDLLYNPVKEMLILCEVDPQIVYEFVQVGISKNDSALFGNWISSPFGKRISPKDVLPFHENGIKCMPSIAEFLMNNISVEEAVKTYDFAGPPKVDPEDIVGLMDLIRKQNFVEAQN
jgi:hypothetical protein